MDKEQLQQQIALYFSKLPLGAQAVFSSMEWLETLKQISQKYNLSEPQIETLGTETTLVLLGIIHLDEYKKIVTTSLNLPTDLAQEIYGEINTKVIEKIRPELSTAFEQNSKTETEEPRQLDTELDEHFNKLSSETKKIIVESQYHDTLYKIAESNKLNVAEMGNLEKITTKMIIGDIHPNKFEDEVKNVLKLPDEKVRALVDAINEQILRKIREKLVGSSTKPKSVASTSTALEISMPELGIAKNEAKILGKAGIEILPPDGSKASVASVASVIPDKTKNTDLFAQKMNTQFQIPKAKTDYTVANLSKNKEATPPKTLAQKSGVDPYREIPK